MDTPDWLRSIRERGVKRRLMIGPEYLERSERQLEELDKAETLLRDARRRIDGVTREGAFAHHAISVLNSMSIKISRLELRLSRARGEIFRERWFMANEGSDPGRQSPPDSEDPGLDDFS